MGGSFFCVECTRDGMFMSRAGVGSLSMLNVQGIGRLIFRRACVADVDYTGDVMLIEEDGLRGGGGHFQCGM